MYILENVLNLCGTAVFFLYPLALLVLIIYNEFSQKTRFQSEPIASLCLYKIQRENLVFKILSVQEPNL